MPLKPHSALATLLTTLLTTPVLAQQPRKAAPAPHANAGFEVRGTLRGAPAGAKVYVVDQLAGRQVRLDSAVVDASGQFILRGAVPEPAVYYLGVAQKPELLALPLTAGARLRVSGAAGQLAATGAATGTPEAEALTAFQQARQANIRQLQALMQRYDARQDAATRAALEQEARDLEAQLAAATRHLARRPTYLAPYAALTLLGQDAQAAFLDSVTAVYQKIQPVSRYTRALLEQRARQRSLAVGRLAPDIQLTSADGQLVPLSSLRGQYVLLDFWSGPGSLQNPALTRLHNAYRAKGFAVYGVVPDASRLQSAADDERRGLPGAAPQGGQPAFGERALPATVLIDPQGRVVAKNLRGAALERKVAALLN